MHVAGRENDVRTLHHAGLPQLAIYISATGHQIDTILLTANRLLL